MPDDALYEEGRCCGSAFLQVKNILLLLQIKTDGSDVDQNSKKKVLLSPPKLLIFPVVA